MPPEFERIGLSGSLSQLIVALPHASTKFEFLCSGTEQRMGKDIQLNAYRIVSELNQNILKHAHARRAAVQLIYFNDMLRVLVEDDGIGSNIDGLDPHPPGMGLKNCMLRADYLGAKPAAKVLGSSWTFLIIPTHAGISAKARLCDWYFGEFWLYPVLGQKRHVYDPIDRYERIEFLISKMSRHPKLHIHFPDLTCDCPVLVSTSILPKMLTELLTRICRFLKFTSNLTLIVR